MTETILKVQDLVTTFKTDSGSFRAVNELSFSLAKGESVGLVGESGCGKSVSALSILRLVQSPPGKIESGSIFFDSIDLLRLSDKEMRRIRGNRISMIFQEPMTSLNPVFTIGDQIGEVFKIHQGMKKVQAREKSLEMLKLVKIPAPEKRIDEYPHQLSGGMRQRVMIAMALACRPALLIADEPTTALDVTIQAQILGLKHSLQQELQMGILMITHDLGVVAEMCSRVLIMYGGELVEQASVKQIFNSPAHPYTIGLLNSIPKLGKKVKRLPTIEGMVPPLGKFPAGCKFQNRCALAKPICRQKAPELKPVANGHDVACWVAYGE